MRRTIYLPRKYDANELLQIGVLTLEATAVLALLFGAGYFLLRYVGA